MQENNAMNLAREFQLELNNIEIAPYNMDESYDYSGCTDFCVVNNDLTTCTIYDLLGSTSAMNLFEKKLSLGLYTIYDCAENFNLENFNDFAGICREKGMALLWNVNPDDVEHLRIQQEVIKFFSPYIEFVDSFLENILPIVNDFAERNREALNRADELSILEQHEMDELGFQTNFFEIPEMSSDPSCPNLDEI